jgi:hypothetical protein
MMVEGGREVDEYVGVRQVTDAAVAIMHEWGHEFVRTDRHDRRRNREVKRSLSPHTVEAVRRFAMRRMRRLARGEAQGLVYSWPKIELQRDPSIRAALVYVWAEYGLVPELPDLEMRLPDYLGVLGEGWTGA